MRYELNCDPSPHRYSVVRGVVRFSLLLSWDRCVGADVDVDMVVYAPLLIAILSTSTITTPGQIFIRRNLTNNTLCTFKCLPRFYRQLAVNSSREEPCATSRVDM